MDTADNHSVRKPSSLFNTYHFGAEYFSKVYKLSSYFGTGQVALDSAEILFQLVHRQNHEYISRSFLSDCLCMETQKVAKALSLLKSSGVVVSHKKGVLLTDKIPKNRIWENDNEAFEYIGVLHSFDYEGAMEKIWDLLALIHTIREWIGLGIPTSSRRHFVACLCYGHPFDCSEPTARIITKSMLDLNPIELAKLYALDDYECRFTEHREALKDKYRRLSLFHKARLLLRNIKTWQNDTPWYVSDESVQAVNLAIQYFPTDTKNQSEIDNKHQTFLYEYLVHHPTADDYDFLPASPFYGKSLEERLRILPKTFGKDTEIYNSCALEQKQWIGVFNATDNSKLKYTNNKGYSVSSKTNGKETLF